MKKLISIFLIILFILSLISCQLISTLINTSHQISLNIIDYSNDSFGTYSLTLSDYGNKISSFTLYDNLIFSYIDITDGTIKFSIKKIDEDNLLRSTGFYNVEDINNNEFKISSGFNFNNINSNPMNYLPIFEKVYFNIFSFYYLNSDYCLTRKELKFIEFFDTQSNSTKYRFEELSKIENNDAFINLPGSNAILYDLSKSQKIAYLTFYNNKYYIAEWDKNSLIYDLINFSGETNYNFKVYDNSNLIEYYNDKIYVASTNEYNIDSNYYLLIYKVDLSNNSNEKIYNSKDEGKIANNIPIKMLYVEEKNKLYIAWSYKENGKDYLAISEYDYQSKKLLDKIKIDITYYFLVDLDLERISVNGIKTSNLKMAYCLKNISGKGIIYYGIIKTNDFSVSSWSIAIQNGLFGENVYYLNISNSPYFFINASKYNFSNELSYELFLIY